MEQTKEELKISNADAIELLNCLREMTNCIQGVDSSNRVVLRIPIELSQRTGKAIQKATT